MLVTVAEESRTCGRRIGVLVELKAPTASAALGLPLDRPLLDVLRRRGVDHAGSGVRVMTFDAAVLRGLAGRTRVPLVQLMEADGAPYDAVLAGEPRTYADMASPAGLAEIAAYADAIGVAKDMVVPRGPDNDLLAPTTLVRDAHGAGLQVHVWTFRSENAFLPRRWQAGGGRSAEAGAEGLDPAARGDAAAELALFLELGVDGVFADDPAVAVPVRDRLFSARHG